MKKELHIPSVIGYCKNCFRERRDGSAYCGKCQNEPPRIKIYQDEQKNFPLFEKIKKKFKINDRVMITYKDTIYFDYELSFDFIAHEIIHIFQQKKVGVKDWWKRYFKDDKFRLEQEVVAYKRQYEIMKKVRGEARAVHLLNEVSKVLSGKLYGNIVSFEKAKKLIIK